MLSTRALSELRDVVQGGAPFVKASKEIAGLFSVAAGHAVPAKVARGSVKEHQDRFSGSRAVEGLVGTRRDATRVEKKLLGVTSSQRASRKPRRP